MCGRCRNVFNAFQSLTRVAESEAVSHHPPPSAESAIEQEQAELTDSIFLREEPLPLSGEFSQTDFPSDIRAHASWEASPARHDETAIIAAVAPANSPFTPPSLLPANNEAADASTSNPLLVPAPRASDDADHTRLWATGAVILLLGLAAQVAFGFRSSLIQSYPQLRPAYVSACEWAGCSLSWGRDDAVIRIEASDLIETPGKAGHIQLTATLVNRGVSRQDLPSMELKLTDSANQVVLSRILLPQEYLGRPPAKDESLAPNVEMYVNLNIELANKAQASGYGVRAFYN